MEHVHELDRSCFGNRNYTSSYVLPCDSSGHLEESELTLIKTVRKHASKLTAKVVQGFEAFEFGD